MPRCIDVRMQYQQVCVVSLICVCTALQCVNACVIYGMVAVDEETGEITGVSDPRKGGSPAAA